MLPIRENQQTPSKESEIFCLIKLPHHKEGYEKKTEEGNYK